MRFVLKPITVLNNASMAATQSVIQRVDNYDSVALQINYTSAHTPVGTIQVLASVDYNPGGYPNDSPAVAGNFAPMYFAYGTSTVNSVAIPAGTSPIILNLSLLAIPYIKILYTASSGGSGDTISFILSGKSIGGT